MRSTRTIVLFLAVLVAPAVAQAELPAVFSVQGVLREDSGVLHSGPVSMILSLYPGQAGEVPLYRESHLSVNSDGGVFTVFLGAGTPVAATPTLAEVITANEELWLGIAADGSAEMSPRLRVAVAPWALQAEHANSCDAAAEADSAAVAQNALALGGRAVSEFQLVLTGACGDGQFLRGVAADGTPTCAVAGDLAEVTATAGGGLLVTGGTGPAPAIGLMSCAAGEILKASGPGAWACAVDVREIAAQSGSGLEVADAAGPVPSLTLRRDCAPGQVLKYEAEAGWECARVGDADGDLSELREIPDMGITVENPEGPTPSVGLTDCGPYEVLRMDEAGETWGCTDGYYVTQDDIFTAGALDTRYFTEDELKLVGEANHPGNPVDWTKLKNIPPQIADGLDADSGGDVTAVWRADGAGIEVGASEGPVPLVGLASCPLGQVLKSSGTGDPFGTWGCSAIGDDEVSNDLTIDNGVLRASGSSNWVRIIHSSQEGPALVLENPSKTDPETANQWAIYNMTGGYNDSLQFWSYHDGGGYTASGPHLTLLDNGNVGVGTTNPPRPFTVQSLSPGSHNPQVLITKDGANGLFLGASSASHHYNWLISEQDLVGGALEFAPSTGPGVATFAVPTVVMLRDGKVGIGTVSPSGRLSVSSSRWDGWDISLDPGEYPTVGRLFYESDGSGYGLSLGRMSSGSGAYEDYLYLKDGGGVGIGTTNPQDRFQVNASRPIIMGSNGGMGVYGSHIGFNTTINTNVTPNTITKLGGTNQQGGAIITADHYGNLAFQMYNAGTEAASTVDYAPQVTFTNAGNVGIGSTAANSKLDVAGETRATNFFVGRKSFSRAQDAGDGWVRVAQGRYSGYGVFSVNWHGSGQHGQALFTVSCDYPDGYRITTRCTSNVVHLNEYDTVGFKAIRFVVANEVDGPTAAMYRPFYVELLAGNNPHGPTTFSVEVKDNIGLTLIDPIAGEVPRDYLARADEVAGSRASLGNGLMTVTSNDRVGIGGTSSPAARLDVRRDSNTGGDVIAFGSDMYNMGRLGEEPPTNTVYLANMYSSGAIIDFRVGGNTSAATKMSVRGGNVGIGTGTDAPAARLEVKRAVSDIGVVAQFTGENSSADDTATRVGIKDETGGMWFLSAMNDGNFELYRSGRGGLVAVDATGNVGIGKPPSATYKLDVNGRVANATGELTSTSDARLKRDIAPIQGALETVKRLRGVTFRWKDPQEDAEYGRMRGFIAQDVEKVIPEWVKTEQDGLKRIERVGMDALLVEAVKEQDGKIRRLEERNRALEERNQDLGRRLEALERGPGGLVASSATLSVDPWLGGGVVAIALGAALARRRKQQAR